MSPDRARSEDTPRIAEGEPRVIVALDFAELPPAMALVERLDPAACALKVGKELFVVGGPDAVRDMVARGFRVFLDLKFHDIPNTAAQACTAATRLGVWMLNVHATGGRAMLIAAREAVARAAAERAQRPPLLIGVTVLTSLDADDVAQIGFSGTPEAIALRLARLAAECGLDGVVCSALEAPVLRREFGAAFKLVTPGIRPTGLAVDDQARVATPRAAVASGADYLVIGRAITRAADPAAALADINRSLEVAA
jgi:orotidine-5'-phosphate decarboxylase